MSPCPRDEIPIQGLNPLGIPELSASSLATRWSAAEARTASDAHDATVCGTILRQPLEKRGPNLPVYFLPAWGAALGLVTPTGVLQ